MNIPLKILLSESPDHIHFLDRTYTAESGLPFFYSPISDVFVIDLDPGFHDNSPIMRKFHYQNRTEALTGGRVWVQSTNLISFWKLPTPSKLKFVISKVNEALNYSPSSKWYIEVGKAKVGTTPLGIKYIIPIDKYKIDTKGFVDFEEKDIVDTFNPNRID